MWRAIFIELVHKNQGECGTRESSPEISAFKDILTDFSPGLSEFSAS
jgi:hypothetical protein